MIRKIKRVIVFDNLVQGHPNIAGMNIPVRALLPDNIDIPALKRIGNRAKKAGAKFKKRFF